MATDYYDHVVMIGIDGLGGYYLDRCRNMQTVMPCLSSLMSNALFSTLKGRTVFPPVSAPAWTSALSGLPVEMHGAATNDWPFPTMSGENTKGTPTKRRTSLETEGYESGTVPPYSGVAATLHGRPYSRPRTIADYANDGGLTVRVLASWPWLTRLFHDDHTCRVDSTNGDDEAAVREFLNEKSLAGFTFVHLDGVDDAGHAYGFGSDEYIKAATVADAHLKAMIDIVKSVAIPILVCICSDHGGSGNEHGVCEMSHMQIPIVFWSNHPHRLTGAALAQASASDTGLLDSPVTGSTQEPSLMDIAPTILNYLGLDIPPSMHGDVLF